MRRALYAGIATLALIGAAVAADLPAKAPILKAPPAPLYDWNGFYVGGYYGTSISHTRATSALRPGAVDINDGGISVGVAGGYNWQISPHWLVGIEGDFDWLGTKEKFNDFNDAARLASGVDTDWYATLRGRFGYVTGASLIYVTGGAAFTRVEETFGVTAAPTALSSTRTGWTAGGGIETKLSKNWSVTTEYLYVDLGSNSFASNAASAADAATFKTRAHVLKSGFNYKLDGGPFEMFPFFGTPFSSPERWAGFYAGATAGGGISLVKVPVVQPLPGEEDINGTGFAGGGHVGYNWLVFSTWLVGVEGDVGYLGINHRFVDWGDSATFGVKTDWYGTVRGRVGSSTGPAFMYMTGGAAFGRVTNTFNSTVSATTPIGSTVASVSGTHAGWTLGGGVETALDTRWSARIEYLYLNLGNVSLDDPTAVGGPVHAEFKNRFQVVRAGVSYKFGGPDVVVAKY